MIARYFESNPEGMEFVAFSSAHVYALLAGLAIVVAIVAFRERLRTEAGSRAARWTIAALLLGSEASLHAWYLWRGVWGWQTVPLHLCSITLWLSAAMLLFRIRGLYPIVFFLGTLGALQALLTPNLDETFPHYRFWHFFVAHIAIVSAAVYMTAVERMRPTLKSALLSFVWLNAFAVPAGIVNAFTGKNYMFLARKPDTASMLDLLAPWPWYILQLELIALALIMFLYGSMAAVDKLFKRMRQRSRS